MRKVVSSVCALLAFATLSTTTTEAKTQQVGGTYDISIAGFTVGRGSLSLVLQGNAYSAKVGMEPAGIGTLFSTGKGGAEATGWLKGKRVLPSRYTMASQAANRDFFVNLRQGSGHVRQAEVVPQFKPSKTRIKMTKRHKRNAMDPLSAAVVPAPSRAKVLDASVCNRTLPIYDGWTRFDVKMEYKTIKSVSGRGYDGDVVVCKVRWDPVAGHRPERKNVKMLQQANDIEAWFAPVGSSRVLIPYRISIPTPTGTLLIQAERLDMVSALSTASNAGN
ncbi:MULTISPECIES: DUF3108 domain-containing protein [Pseudovibrio]|uniref:DUF3108 domain-containing protein n=1 Tax=Stappiaceae TaxID=2821832 RepID=UPI0023672783|nr:MULTISPECIES: DUF3108 domain-containing protein [Pseudovibrio]MDD7909343.1 DUF3108 domain-containing protein [Pseudovibrio exalbescens]MDX5594903.1 DUF3108 domain-containing protein [Pseudovibrio sp. SPO723]